MNALDEIERYRKNRRWLRAQRKRIIAARKPLASMPTVTREDRTEFYKYERYANKVACQVSPHASGGIEYSNKMTKHYARKRDRHRKALKALGA